MLALVKDKQAVGAALRDCPIPKISSGEALIKVHRASICGSDLAIYNWNSWAPKTVKPPLIFGHEVCGEVVESKDQSWKPGTRVACESHIWCGKCFACRTGDFHVCRNLKILGVDRPGGFAEYLSMPGKCLRKIANPKFYDLASMFEPLGNAVYATSVESVGNKTVLVFGCGPQGLFAIQVAKALGAKLVVAVENSPFRRVLAKKMGADFVISPSKERLLSFKEASQGYDVVLEMSGSRTLIALAFEVLRNGGRLSFFGLPSEAVPINIADHVIFKGLRIYGILGRRIWQTWDTMERLLAEGKIDLEPMVTHVFKLADFQKAFALMLAPEKKCGKIIFEIGE